MGYFIRDKAGFLFSKKTVFWVKKDMTFKLRKLGTAEKKGVHLNRRTRLRLVVFFSNNGVAPPNATPDRDTFWENRC